MALARTASGDHPRCARRELPRRGRTVRRPRPARRGRRHRGPRRWVRRGACRRMAGRARGCFAPGLRGRCVVDTGARCRRLRTVRGGHRHAVQASRIQSTSRGATPMTTTTPRPPEGDWLGTPYLHFTREGPFGVCTLDRPKARNAMTPAMYFGIRYAVRHVDADPDLAGLVITGTGDVFAPGGDMGGGDGSDNWLTFGSALGMDVTPFETLRQSVKPVVSAVNGLCQGGGLQIALCSDMTVVSDRATFRVPELFRGIADTYYSQMLARLIGPVRTRDLMFTGRTLSAAEALDWGMVARVVPHDDLFDVSTELLAQCCRTAPAARGVIKGSLDNYMGLYDRIGMQASLFGPETREGFVAFKEKRSPSWVHPDLRVDGRL